MKIMISRCTVLKRCVKSTDLDSDGHTRSGYGSKKDGPAVIHLKPYKTHVGPKRHFVVRTLMDFNGFHGKRSKVRNKALRISMMEVQDGIPTLKSI